MRSSSIWIRLDYTLLTVTAILIVFGVLMIRSATMDAISDDLIRRVPDQIQYALIGTGLMFILTIVDYRMLGSLHVWLYLLLIGLLVMVIFFGTVGDAGARRWLNLGILIQPSELGKIIIIVTLGHYLSMRYQQLERLTTLLGSLLHLGIPLLLIFLQPDLGTSIVYVVLWFTLVWAAGLRIKHIALFLAVSVILMPVMWSQMEDYQKMRITNFVAPDEDDTQGSTFNIRQAAISIGSGGLFGQGYANGTQSQLRFLRVRHTDFIFSVIAEEFGFVGGVSVMILIGIVIMRILRGARTAADPLGSMICYGVASIIFFQTAVSIGMNLGLLPVTGLTLPFISSGGTSLLATLAGIGLVQSVIIRRSRLS